MLFNSKLFETILSYNFNNTVKMSNMYTEVRYSLLDAEEITSILIYSPVNIWHKFQ